MSDNRREALEALRDKVKAGDDAGFRRANRAAFSTPCQDMALQLREEHCRHAYKGSLDAAKALHKAVLPGWDWRAEENVNGYVSHIGPAREEFMPSIMAISFESAARAWLLAILSALISETPKGETP